MAIEITTPLTGQAEATASPSRHPGAGFLCANCRIDIVAPPVVHAGVAFCCAGCVADGPCTCSYDEIGEGADDWEVHDCLDVTALDDEAPRLVTSRR